MVSRAHQDHFCYLPRTAFVDELCKALFIQNSLISTWTVAQALRLFSPRSFESDLILLIFRCTVTLLNGSAMLMMLFYEGDQHLSLCSSEDLFVFVHLDFALCLLLVLSLFLSKSIFIAGPTLCSNTCSLIEWLLLSMGCSSLFLSINLHWWSYFEVCREDRYLWNHLSRSA